MISAETADDQIASMECSEPTSSTISSCTSAGTSCSVRNGSSTFSSTSTLDFSSCGSVDEDWEISGRSSPLFSSTPKEKGQPKEDGCTPPVNEKKKATTASNSEKSKKSSEEKVLPGWLSKFHLPSRFSASVETGLKAGFLTANQKSEFVREVCISINHFTSHPKKTEREFIAKQIIAKYPCMASKVLVDSDTEWGYLELKIFNRMKKIQKPKRLAGTRDSQSDPKPKKQKTKTHTWSAVPDLPEGESVDSLRTYANENLDEIKKNPKKHKLHKEFMDKTFALRRRDILTAPKLVKDVLKEYPSLTNFTHLKAELCRIFDDDDIPTKVREKYQMWQQRILKYAAGSKDKVIRNIMGEMEAALGDKECDREEMKSRASFVVINKVLRNRGGRKKGTQEEVISIVERDAEVDDTIAGFVQPQILIVGDIFDVDIMYIVAEGGIICQLPQKSILDALLGLLGSFYIFNVSYNQSKAILTFLEQALLEIGRGQTLVTVSSFFNDLASA